MNIDVNIQYIKKLVKNTLHFEITEDEAKYILGNIKYAWDKEIAMGKFDKEIIKYANQVKNREYIESYDEFDSLIDMFKTENEKFKQKDEKKNSSSVYYDKVYNYIINLLDRVSNIFDYKGRKEKIAEEISRVYIGDEELFKGTYDNKIIENLVTGIYGKEGFRGVGYQDSYKKTQEIVNEYVRDSMYYDDLMKAHGNIYNIVSGITLNVVLNNIPNDKIGEYVNASLSVYNMKNNSCYSGYEIKDIYGRIKSITKKEMVDDLKLGALCAAALSGSIVAQLGLFYVISNQFTQEGEGRNGRS